MSDTVSVVPSPPTLGATVIYHPLGDVYETGITADGVIYFSYYQIVVDGIHSNSRDDGTFRRRMIDLYDDFGIFDEDPNWFGGDGAWHYKHDETPINLDLWMRRGRVEPKQTDTDS
jgi:hypothetical protein